MARRALGSLRRSSSRCNRGRRAGIPARVNRKRRGAAARAVVVSAWALAACAPDHADVVEIAIEAPERHWTDGGFVRMEPPVHLPSSLRGEASVEVWLRLPADGEIATVVGADGVARLEFPPGTVADRVEHAGFGEARRVVDVRGATIDDDGHCRWHVLRPRDGDDGLTGLQWPCDDPHAQSAATTAMIEALRAREPLASMSAARRERDLASFAAKNDCGGCHARARPDAQLVGEHGIVHRGTDASGFFVPTTVLRDAVPLEDYGLFDPNVDDPAIAIDCGTAPPAPDARARPRCTDRRVPIGRLDWARARAHDAARVERICEARAALEARLDSESRTRWSAASDPCARG